jgi:hypothetical protein
LRPSWVTQWDPVSKTKGYKEKRKERRMEKLKYDSNVNKIKVNPPFYDYLKWTEEIDFNLDPYKLKVYMILDTGGSNL